MVVQEILDRWENMEHRVMLVGLVHLVLTDSLDHLGHLDHQERKGLQVT